MIINENLCNLSNVYSGAKFNALLGNCCILFQLQVTHISTDARFRETTPRLFFTRTLCVTTQFKSDEQRFNMTVTNRIRAKLSDY
jgi:hypothetical protein